MTETRLEIANYMLRQLNSIKDEKAVLNNLTNSGHSAASLFPTLSVEERDEMLKIIRDCRGNHARTTTNR